MQNLPLRHHDGTPTTLMALLADGTQCLGLWFTPTRAQAEAATEVAASLPLHLVAVGGDSGLPTLQHDEVLAHHLGDARPGSLCLVRPDAYRAALLDDPTPAAITAAVRSALTHR